MRAKEEVARRRVELGVSKGHAQNEGQLMLYEGPQDSDNGTATNGRVSPKRHSLPGSVI